MRVIVAGPRTNFSTRAVCQALERARATMGIWPAVLVCGQATGIDTAAAEVCDTLGIDIDPHPITAEHRTTHGIGAGLVRNGEMESCADALVAVWDGQSPGTWDMVHRMVIAGKPVFLGMLKGYANKNDLHTWARRAKSAALFTWEVLDYAD